ncbi:hypothetical protein ACBW88_001168 [Listeria monocytogenes]|uniref:hypothetical protein n=1 Tax=Listeria monocytogenes TaxID=1639 RepID=UPI00043680FF|nr:hypothetical protein [Listeria monocytogenes]EAA0100606.1 hypothetical protein [Listeria monocytogenes]EAC4160616.1 hypothetical protein [Listeria monocytogenes]EAC5700583.1 hypothetical protein [Listeria monocytogenes]EAC6044099.1 hypothetical protein [Listeria monocytogenes]EAC6053101.1 hypothetical protein [Listeria monocytogenes]
MTIKEHLREMINAVESEKRAVSVVKKLTGILDTEYTWVTAVYQEGVITHNEMIETFQKFMDLHKKDNFTGVEVLEVLTKIYEGRINL